jgi:PST family polysaccharide transporter
LFLLAKPFISVTLGPKWQQVALLIQILAPVGAIQSIGSTVGLIYQAKGRTDWLFRWGIFSVSIIIIAFIIGIQYGIDGVATAYGIIIFMITYPNFAIPFRLIELQFTDLLQVLKIHILNSAIMATAILIVWRLLPPFISDILLLAILIPIGMLAYFTSVYYTNRSQLTEILSQIKLLV